VLRVPQVAAKIHQTYRIQYLKDVILPRSLDDATYATLASLMLFNNVDVVLGLASDATFLPQVGCMSLQRAQKGEGVGGGECQLPPVDELCIAGCAFPA
jgi:hypothetical protein